MAFGVSIGNAIGVPDGDSFERLLNQADKAMCQAKQDGGNRVLGAPSSAG